MTNPTNPSPSPALAVLAEIESDPRPEQRWQLTAQTTLTPTPITHNMAIQLIGRELERAIGASPIQVHVKLRTTWNGDGYNILYDAVVQWTRDDGADRGTHQATVSVDGRGARASLFWGHYNLGDDVRSDYLDRIRRL